MTKASLPPTADLLPTDFLPAHSLPAMQVLEALDTSERGLTTSEAATRLQRHGPNSLPAPKGRPAILRFLAQFNNALIYFLLFGAAAAALLSHWVDASVILAVVLVNAVVGFLQEGKAEDALAGLRHMIAPQAHGLRDGKRISVPVPDLVPGDIVLIEAGDRVPADLRLLQARNLLIDEAALTGESVAASKSIQPVAADAPLGDRSAMGYSGTLVAAGQGMGVVTATGQATEIGRISQMLGEVRSLGTPLLRQINRFAGRFTLFGLVGAVLLVLFAVFARGFAWDEALMAAIALTVGLVPEGLPAVITITLAIGVQRMAARNAVIRHLPAVETLGATSIICSDKTGTLTRNEMTVRRVVTPAGVTTIEGAGYDPSGHDFTPDGLTRDLLRVGALCNDAALHSDGWTVEGDPMEGALIAAAMKAGLAPKAERAAMARLDTIPFDAAHAFMATLHETADRGPVLLIKGAPERLLALSTDQAGPDGSQPLDVDFWTGQIDKAGAEGERVLGYAVKPMPPGTATITLDDIATGLSFLGVTGFIDPPRPEAMRAIAECHSAGIEVRMITGDHAATAAAIARQLGLADDPKVLTGPELDQLDEASFGAAIADVQVFARTSPEHKLRIVRALQAQGRVVAMTGDGVNDAPSLKQADVGISMGIKGTEAAKEASQMVLLDDNFASIVAAVHEGRTVHDNIRKVIGWTLPTNGGETLTVLLAIILNFALPMTPVQILWINLILAGTLGLALAFEPSEPGVMARKPRSKDAGLLSPFMIWRIALVSVLFTAISLGVFFWVLGQGRDIEVARTMVVNTLVVMEIFYMFNVRYLHMRSFTLTGLKGTTPVMVSIAVVVMGQLAFTYLPVMNRIFESRPLGLMDGLVAIAFGIVLMVVLEIEKHFLRDRFPDG